MKRIALLKLKNGIKIECDDELIKWEEAFFRSEEVEGWIEHTKRYYVRSRNFCIEFLQEDIESADYKIEQEEEHKEENEEEHEDVSKDTKDIYECKNNSFLESSLFFIKELCELGIKEIRKNNSFKIISKKKNRKKLKNIRIKFLDIRKVN